MGDSTKPSGDWKTERISMTNLANFSRSSTYVRSLVRQQFHPQSDQPNTAWERLRERLSKNGGSFDYEEEMPNFIKKKESGVASNNGEEASDNEDEENEEETYVYLKTANPNHRSSVTNDPVKPATKNWNEESADTPPSSHSYTSAASPSRRLSAPQTPGSSLDTEKTYTLPSTDAHSKILNRRLSLAENVIKNYAKYIRTPDEPRGIRTTSVIAETERASANKQPPIVAISEEESSPLVNRTSAASTPCSDFLAIPETYSPGSSYTVPPSPAANSDISFFDAPVRRNSLGGEIPEDFLLTRSGTDVTSVSTKDKRASDVYKLPRLAQTSKVRTKKLSSAESRVEAIEKLRGDYEKLSKNKRLKRRVGRKKETVFQQLQRDQERRAREAEIFNQEMEQITKTLQAINTRLDERIEVLDCADPPKVNARLQRILQVALAGVPFKSM